ncbi:Uncharacterised protein [Mycobacterium tuberculosis]|nr:Uncharacterised protein [Mycobacterium tuberculosis]
MGTGAANGGDGGNAIGLIGNGGDGGHAVNGGTPGTGGHRGLLFGQDGQEG